ncbi:hypothetical protein LPB90_18485 [Chryseobacterium sp. LC2016-29]|uniref:hypothetical protein n=1 Tax=Chryseobacterium sp. LC2016-29 TaxID=2897331 RepID=UPI001E452873|nr:hypothetical protein [Chryseobacterium sp. LC2016-29]MCD0480431.1 hypothetical protein [Chryseobacterium sp. LC2016-29]
MVREKVILFYIDNWFKEYNYLFTLTNDYDTDFLKFVVRIVDDYIKENNLNKIDDDLLWAHIRFILGNTYKQEIETYKIKKDVEGF